ncbi:MAG TPA: 30S ribosomal protein S12 methylthiotransferase RimO [Bacillota bacterium]
MKKFAVVSLGCAKNLVDSEIMLGQLVAAGWELTQDFAEAELILVNTCGFIESAKRESIEHILTMARYKQPGVGKCRKLVIAGCLVQRYAKELVRDLPEVDYWVGLGEIGAVATKIEQESADRTPALTAPFLNEINLPRYQVTLPHTAYVKIAEGCNHRCSYCAIPLIKGSFRSRNPESIVWETIQLVQAGVKEVNLIAQDITMYGHDLKPASNLTELLRRIIAEAKPKWIRLLYAYPFAVDTKLLELIAGEPSICKYLDLPIQHINPRILKLMNRPDSPELLRSKLRLIREIVPEIVLRTTFIVGFPTETEAEFGELVDFIKEFHFEHIGVFCYSREEQTDAYQLRPQIKKAVKARRRRILLQAQQPIVQQFLGSQVNRELSVLVDRVSPEGLAVGRSQAFAPDVDGVIYLEGYQGQPGKLVRCRVTGQDGYNLRAEVLTD